MLLSGEVVGTWSFKESKHKVKMDVKLFKKISLKSEDKLCMEIDRLGDFIGGEEKQTEVELIYQ